ncbi:MAG: helix-turn-helix domain-containing protein [Rhodomicrobium sp.]
MMKRKCGGKGDGKRIGELIRKARRELNLTQPELAERLSKALELDQPLSLQTISKWERGGRGDFTVPEVSALVKVLKRNPNYFDSPISERSDPSKEASSESIPTVIDQREPLVPVFLERLRSVERKVALMWDDLARIEGRLDALDNRAE